MFSDPQVSRAEMLLSTSLPDGTTFCNARNRAEAERDARARRLARLNSGQHTDELLAEWASMPRRSPALKIGVV